MSRGRSGDSGSSSSNEPLLFIEQGPGNDGPSSRKKRNEVRKRAALASAGTRKATIAVRDARRIGYWSQTVSQQTGTTDNAKTDTAVADDDESELIRRDPTSDNHIFQQLVQRLAETQIERTSLPHRAVRTVLWDGMVNSTVLFQTSLFVSSTYRNTCGVQASAQQQKVSLLLLRGASIEVVSAAVTAASESLTPFAIAMLASWERQYGDSAAHEVHMQGWKSLSMASDTLDENNVTNLSDLTLATFREGLGERAMNSPIALQARSTTSYHILLPLGFWHFHIGRPEARSLLDIVSQLQNHNPQGSESIARIRRLALETSAWTPYHTYSTQPMPAVEDSWDQEELNALYHVRAVCIVIVALSLKASLDAHGVDWPWDVRRALAIHTSSCRNLRTEELVKTKYQEIGVWTRFMLCAMCRVPEQDEYIRGLLLRLNLRTWKHMQALLKRHIWLEWLCEPRCFEFFEELMKRGRRELSMG